MSRPREFDLGRPFVALRALTFGARTFAPGDVVPCRELGLDDLRIFRLWGQYKIGHADSATQPAGPDALGGFEVLARIGASIAPPPAAPAKPAKRTRAGA